MGAWIVSRFKRGLGKRRGYVFEVRRRGGGGGEAVENPMHTMSWRSLFNDINTQSKYCCNTVLLLIILTIIDT